MRIAFFFAITIQAAVAQTFPIAGVVVDGTSGAPMNRVRVQLTATARPSDQRAIFTGADGRFSFDVPRGKFGIVAEYRGFRQPFGQSGPAAGFGVAIFTGPDQDASHLVFRWFALGAISGRVTDDRGEPVENALVQLIRVSVVVGRKTRSTVAWARTNDLGEYRFGQRAGGTYYLAVTGEPWYAARTQALSSSNQPPGPGADDAQGEPPKSYAPVYYPNATEPKSAQPLELAPGAEVAADFRLSMMTGVKVHIHSPQPARQSALITLLSDGAAGVETYQRQVWLFGNDQTIAGVFPGQYVVSIDGRNGNTSSARKGIEVGGSDVTVELLMGPPPTVTGTVTYKDPGRRPRRPAYVRLIAETNGSAIASPVDAAGAFSFSNVPPGRRRVQLSGVDGFFATQITAEGAGISGPTIDIASGANVRLAIVAADEIGSLKGFVMKGERPAAGVLAVLAPKDDSDDPGEYRGYQTDSDGSFDYRNVRAGEYVLFAVERLDLEYTNPTVVRPYFASGQTVHIAAHAEAVENVNLAGPDLQR